jgi:hypothetical protein
MTSPPFVDSTEVSGGTSSTANDTNGRAFVDLCLDPPTDVSIPSQSDSDELTTSVYLNLTDECPSSLTSSMSSSSSSSTTMATVHVESSPPTRVMATSPLINEVHMQDASTTVRSAPSRTRSRSTSQSTLRKATDNWLQSYHQTRSSTEPMKVNYADRSKLDLCDGFYDAITMYKGILFIFKGQVRRRRLSRPWTSSGASLVVSSSISGSTTDVASILIRP